MEEVYALLFIIVMFYISSKIFNKFILLKLIEMDTMEIERNPKWIMKDVTKQYYGFQDIDIILAETTVFMSLPRLRATKEGRFELLVPNDITTREVDEILKLALAGKIQIKYGVFFPDKPLHWLSILCYMLDGGDVMEATAKFEEKQETS